MEITASSRAIYDKLAKGWNTWDVKSVTAYVFLPDKVRLNLHFFMTHMQAYTGDHRWEQTEQFGEHAADGSYTDITVRLRCVISDQKTRTAKCRVETAANGREMVIRVTPVTQAPFYYMSLSAEPIWGGRLTIGYQNDSIQAESINGTHIIRSLSPIACPAWHPVTSHQITADANNPAYFTINSDRDAAGVDFLISAKRKQWLDSVIETEDDDLRDALSAMRRCLIWNTIYDPVNARVLTPVSRNWCQGNGGFGDYVVFGWDTFFAGLQMGLVSRDLAYANIFSILEEITPEGMIPNFGCGTGQSRDRSEPQVGSLCVWKLYIQFGDVWFVKECYERLLMWNRWRFLHRDQNRDGLMELASTPWEYSSKEELWGARGVGTLNSAMLESGIDNSPMWDRAAFNEERNCMELSYCGLNALMVMDCQILAKMALLLGKDTDAAELTERAERLAALINKHLWDEKAECYLNRHWSGDFDPCLSLTHFYTLLTGAVPDDRADKLINKHLLNPDEFWGDYIIPNVSRNDPAFLDQDYWRGRIWAPTNYLVAEGLLRHGLRDVRSELIQKGFSMFLNCWRDKGIVGENYNAITGEAAETGKASDRFYHWGALLAYLMAEESVCFNAWTDRTEVNAQKPLKRVPQKGMG